MHKKPTKPDGIRKAANDRASASPEPGARLLLADFELWLELQLLKLEGKYESFTTIKSTRDFFNPKSR